MCNLVEEYATKRVTKAVAEAEKVAAAKERTSVISFIKAGVSDELIKVATNLSDKEIQKLRAEIGS